MSEETNLGYYYCIDCDNIHRHKTNPDMKICERCGSDNCVHFPNGFTLNINEIMLLSNISKNKSFWEAMIELKEKDIVEFELKMNQFKTNNQKQQEVSNVPHCPKCGSTSITTGARGVNFTWGLLGASKTVNRCSNCGHTWKPKK